MPASNFQPKSFFQKNWHYLYFFLAAIVILAVSISLIHSRINFQSYTDLVELSSKNLQVLTLYANLTESAQQVNAPANDIFQSLDSSLETKRYISAVDRFNNDMKNLESAIQKTRGKRTAKIRIPNPNGRD
jgi:hypothetical protein